MKIFTTPLILFMLLFFQSQDGTMTREFSSTLLPGERMDLETGSIRFKEVISDSRCPKDVTCIWPGEAKVLVELLQDGRVCGEEVIVVQNNNDLLQVLTKWFPGKEFTLAASGLYPYPETGGKITPSEYRLTLKVAEKGNDD